jgi:pyruvate formate lyase activating enzyme
LQPDHKLGIHKWDALGWDYQLKDAKENTKEELQQASDILSNYFKKVKIN